MKLRAFLAFDIPDDVRMKLAAMIELMKGLAAGIAWVDSQKIHGTLKFLGDDVDEELLMREIMPRLETLIVDHETIQLSSHGLGVFPDWRYPKVIWAGLEGEMERLQRLQQQIEAVCASFGFPKESRAFRPHLTLGRIKGAVSGKRDLLHFIEKQVLTEFGAITVDCLTLYRSVLTPRGSQHTPLRGYPLKRAERSTSP